MRLLILTIFCATSCAAFSQNSSVKAIDPSSVPDTAIMRKLVELATSGPSSRLIEHQSKILEHTLKGAKNTWLNLLTFSMNYNDLTLTGANTTYVYPKYFFGLNIPLGTILSRTQVKATKEQIKVKEVEREVLVRNLKRDILKMYLQYKNYGERILLQTNVVDDEETFYEKSKEDFKNGSVTMEAYTLAQKRYNEELVKSKQLELDRDMLKLEIEAIIGITIEEVIQQVGASMKKK